MLKVDENFVENIGLFCLLLSYLFGFNQNYGKLIEAFQKRNVPLHELMNIVFNCRNYF